jgi:hypothetical protein
MTMRSRLLCGVTALCCLGTAAVAEEPRPDPIVGTWKLNRSQSTQAPDMPKEQTEIYRESKPGQLELTLSRVTTDGGSTTVILVWPSTGGIVEYHQGTQPKGELLVETALARGDWYVTYMTDGRQWGTMHKVVSPDGKTMRETFKGMFQGQAVEAVFVVERQ